MEPSTSSEPQSNLFHMPTQDVVAFGVSNDLSDIYLPSKHDILKYYFFLSYQTKNENKMFSYKNFSSSVADKLVGIWSKLNIDIINRKSIILKLNKLLDKYHKEIKNRFRSDTFQPFLSSLKELFYIGILHVNVT